MSFIAKGPTTEELMQELLHETVIKLLNKIRSGEADPRDYANAIKLLHNNKITVEIMEAEPPEGMLSEELPFEDGKIISLKVKQGI